MKILAVIVSYNPDAARLRDLVERLASQGAQVLIVDNSDQVNAELPEERCCVIRLGRNTGIACAQNIGIRRALEQCVDVIVLFDQDSEPGECYLSNLLIHVDVQLAGVVAPVCVDRASQTELPSFNLSSIGAVSRVLSRDRTEPYRADLVIASGCAITAKSFEYVGLMDEELFIDFVDFEWCLRCRASSVPIWVVPGARLIHSIGLDRRGANRFAGTVHSAVRTYYKIRNGFLLFRKPYVPKLFAARAIVLSLLHTVASLPALSNKMDYLRVLVRAIRDGLRGTTGPMRI